MMVNNPFAAPSASKTGLLCATARLICGAKGPIAIRASGNALAPRNISSEKLATLTSAPVFWIFVIIRDITANEIATRKVAASTQTASGALITAAGQ